MKKQSLGLWALTVVMWGGVVFAALSAVTSLTQSPAVAEAETKGAAAASGVAAATGTAPAAAARKPTGRRSAAISFSSARRAWAARKGASGSAASTHTS